MTGIWTNTGEGWQLGYPQVFQEEATLHKLIEENPQLLPLAGSPRLTILGSEIKLGTGYADILAVESIGGIIVQGHRGRITATRADQAADLAVLSPYKSLSMAGGGMLGQAGLRRPLT